MGKGYMSRETVLIAAQPNKVFGYVHLHFPYQHAIKAPPNRRYIIYKASGFTKQLSINRVNDYKAFRSDGLLTSLSSVSREEMAKLLVANLALA